jgi:inorganic pyrophosphatase
MNHIQDLTDVSDFDRLEIQHFFETYKDLEPGKSVEGAHWAGRVEAEAEVVNSRRRLIEHGDQAGHGTQVAHFGD